MSDAQPGLRPGGSAAAAVADSLAETILADLPPGAQLPSEAELTKRFAVSRLTVREAVKLLEGRGLLELAKGRRATVRQPDGSMFTAFLASHVRNDPKGLFDLVEVRLALEPQSAMLAAGRAGRGAVELMDTTMEEMRQAALAGDDASERAFNLADQRFHEAVALASGNRVLIYLFEAMAEPLRESFFISRKGNLIRGHTREDTLSAHQQVLDAVRAGNSRAAGEAMRQHLKDTLGDLRAALSEMGRP
jgi:GntR family transcriptional regulator, transcriptional repressor for pyruvate dehydrogenase complex